MNKKKLKKAKAELAKEKAICKKHRKMCKKHTKKLAKHQRSQEHLERIINAAKYIPNTADDPRILSRGGEQSVFSVPNGTGSFLETAFKNRAHLVANVPEPADRYTDAEIVERCLDQLDIVNDRNQFLADLCEAVIRGEILVDTTAHEFETIDFSRVESAPDHIKYLLTTVPQLGELMDADVSQIQIALNVLHGQTKLEIHVDNHISNIRYPSEILRIMKHNIASEVYNCLVESIIGIKEPLVSMSFDVPTKYDYTILGDLDTYVNNVAILVCGLFLLNAIMRHADVSEKYWSFFEKNFLGTPIYTSLDTIAEIETLGVFVDNCGEPNNTFIIPVDNGHLLEMDESGKYDFMFRLKEEDESDKEAGDSTVEPVSDNDKWRDEENNNYGRGEEPGPTKMSI